MFLDFKQSLSKLFVPVAVTQTSFKFKASPIVSLLINTLLTTTTSASLVLVFASSSVE